jgi:hypothetical protein
MMRRLALPLVPLHDLLYSLLPYHEVPIKAENCPYPSIAVIEIIGVPYHPFDLLFEDLVRNGRPWASSLVDTTRSLRLCPVPGCPRYPEYLADHRDRVRRAGELMDDFFRASSI